MGGVRPVLAKLVAKALVGLLRAGRWRVTGTGALGPERRDRSAGTDAEPAERVAGWLAGWLAGWQVRA